MAQNSPDKAGILSGDSGFPVLFPCGHFVLYVPDECVSICCATGRKQPSGEVPLPPTTHVLHATGAPSPDPEKALSWRVLIEGISSHLPLPTELFRGPTSVRGAATATESNKRSQVPAFAPWALC